MKLLAEARLPQFIRGAQVMGSFCKRNNESPISVKRRDKLTMRVNTYEDSQRKMRFVDGLLEIVQHYSGKEYGKSFFLVRTVENDVVLKRMAQQELSPPLHFYEKVVVSGGFNG